jgi:hypothetical protein
MDRVQFLVHGVQADVALSTGIKRQRRETNHSPEHETSSTLLHALILAPDGCVWLTHAEATLSSAKGVSGIHWIKQRVPELIRMYSEEKNPSPAQNRSAALQHTGCSPY